MARILVNGESTACVDARDRGFQYGDGLFETLAVIDGSVRDWPAHWARLCKGCDRLALVAPDESLVLAEIEQVISNDATAVVKLVLTRGVQGRGYRPATTGSATRVVSAHPWPDYPAHYTQDGIAATLCKTPLGLNPRLAGIKHLNRLEQVLARGEWADEYQEGVMCDTRGNAVSGTMSNLFLVAEDGLVTPVLSECGIEGTMRAQVLKLASASGIAVSERTVPLEELSRAQGLFFTNSIIGI